MIHESMKSLGKTLKENREQIPLTLRQVEEATGISNAYLSQLENDKIKKPSANVLYKLANMYKIELDVLLSAAGIIEKKKQSVQNDLTRMIAFYADKFTEAEEKEIIRYIQYLRFKNKDG